MYFYFTIILLVVVKDFLVQKFFLLVKKVELVCGSLFIYIWLKENFVSVYTITFSVNFILFYFLFFFFFYFYFYIIIFM